MVSCHRQTSIKSEPLTIASGLIRICEWPISASTKTAFGMWANPDYRTALAQRINEKIALASRYDTRALVAETWLIVSASLNRWGATACTIIMPPAVCVEDLNRLWRMTT